MQTLSKNNFTPSSYLGLTSKLSESNELVKFRIGNHKLRIRTGRYDQIPRVNRLCPICASHQIEDESHFPIYCNEYSILRLKNRTNIIPTFATIAFVTSHLQNIFHLALIYPISYFQIVTLLYKELLETFNDLFVLLKCSLVSF